MSKSLDSILSERGLNWRQHYGLAPNWGLRQPSILDLSPEALARCRKNPGAYGKRLWGTEDILFPSTEFSQPYTLAAPEFGKNFIASVPEGNNFYLELARKMGGKVIADTEKLPENEPAVIFGSSAENKHACRLAILQKVMANGLFPGKGGWSLEFPYGKTLRAVVCCDESSVKAFLKHWEGSRTPKTVPGPFIPEIYRDAEKLLKEHVSHHFEVNSFEEFVKLTSEAFDCGGPEVGRDNGHCTVPPMIRCFYAYKYTGDSRFLEAFKELFFAMVRYYLTLPGGASYISDYDFYLGSLINCFAAAEREELFTEDDRLLGAAFMLSSFRLIEKFGKSHWPMREGVLRFNHETFPAMSCYWGALYYGEMYGLKADAARWKFYAKIAFEGGELSRTWRQKENSGSYQWIVPSQKLQWDLAVKGKPSPGFRRMAEAVQLISDNDGRQVCYGDCEALTGSTHRDMLHALAQVSNDQLAADLADRLFYGGASSLPVPGWGGYLRLPPVPREGTLPGKGWQMQPLVSHIYKRFPEAVKSKVDKAVFRDEKRYLLFEPCSCDAHKHYDTGAILTFQYGKHLWLVDNGYGFDVRNTPVNMVSAYSAREVGPHCHNMIILRDKEGKAIKGPEFSLFRRSGDTLFCEVTFAGCIWKRTVTLLEKGLRVVDKVKKVTDGDAVTVECQFNSLGENSLKKNVWTLTQKEGGCAELRFKDSGKVKVKESSYLTRGWQNALKKAYFYAEGDVKQLSRTAVLPEDGKEVIFESTFTVL